MKELKKVHSIFQATILSNPSDIIPLKSKNFSKQEFMENLYWYLQEVSLLKTFLSKIDVDIINRKFLFWLCSMKLFMWHNPLILQQKCAFIWCFYQFNTSFCVILHYLQSKREILRQKEKQYSVKLHGFFFVFYVGWTYILRSSLFSKVVSQWI